MISFNNLLNAAPHLHKLLTKLQQLRELNQLVSTLLEPSLAAQCQVANLRDGMLILSTTSPAWKHKLRFATSDLLSALRAYPAWSSLKSIEIRIDYISQ